MGTGSFCMREFPLRGSFPLCAGGLLLVTAVCAQNQTAPPTTVPADQAAFFEAKIRPVLASSCYSCHGKDAQLGGLRLDSREAILKGGATGPSIVPGDPDKSLLIRAVQQAGQLKMPQGGKLTADKIADLAAWVKMGAPWPVSVPKVASKPPLWSLHPVRKPSAPTVKNRAWAKNPIDAFVLARIEARGMTPAPAADRRTLLRRVTYDLIGLPPTAAETDSFLADKSPNAYEKVVDRLLASAHYGEKWARHWLDVARYADTKGYVFEEDRNYYSAYTYRDWVIDALNNDLPYDQFITQQLAADRLPEIQNGEDKKPLSALGFLTIGRRFLNSQPDIIDDRIDVTMRGLQGLTVACARCHDHKFDPIPTQDYYSLYGVFASSDEVASPISERSIRDPWEQFNKRVSGLEASVAKLAATQVSRLRSLVAKPETATTLSQEVRQTLMGLREETPATGDTLRKLSAGFEPAAREQLAGLQRDIADLRKNTPKTPEFAMAMTDRGNGYDSNIFKRGNPGNQGAVAPRRFLLALSKPGEEREHWTVGSGRLQLAQAIASTSNPLTARVFVNRIWQNHLGAGLVRTPSDFGYQGEKPTHPELLDYLASTFMENGWSIKRLHRMIVTSATYRQSSVVTPAVQNADPDNRLICRMNRHRLDLEQMRDTMMTAAGEIDLERIGGKSVDIWSQPFAPRRAVYGFVERQNLPGIFRTFDFASPDSTSARRFVTTVPQQALFLMNSPFSVDQATKLASRKEIAESTDDAQRVRRLYRILFARLPDADELATGVSYLKRGDLSQIQSVWQYGYGEFDAQSQQTRGFVPLGHFQDGMYRVGTAFPDAALGYITLNAGGGHPGHDAQHAVIRRWTAPAAMTVTIRGQLAHGQKEGDGVRARIISSRYGKLGEWTVHNSSSRTDVDHVSVEAGDVIDFIVDPIATDAYDGFGWAPSIKQTGGGQTWDASAMFSKPPSPPLSRIVAYAQALMMTNEFMFVD